MARLAALRTWSTPLTIGSFILMSATGILMFFEWNPGLITVVHQWFSWLFLLGAGGHIFVNIRPFGKHLKNRWGRSSIAVFTLVLAASFFSWGMVTGPQLEMPVEQDLVDAPLAALAGVVRVPPDELVRRMKERGVAATGEQSIGELARASGVSENRLLAIVFLE